MITINDCQDVAKGMEPYVARDLPTDEHAAIDAHLQHCSSCREELQQYRSTRDLLKGALGPGMISSDFLVETGKRLREVTPDDATFEVEEWERPPRSFVDEMTDRMGSAPWWLISGAFHALLILLVTLIGMAILRTSEDSVVIVTDLAERKEPEKIEETVKRDVFRKPVPIETTEIEQDQTIVTHEEVEVAEEIETDNDSDAHDTRGEDGISDVWLGGSGTVAALGLGGGGGGAFGRPNGAGGRLRRAIRGGGGKATESAVDAALRWLARNQEADGSWSAKKHGADRSVDPGVTGLATLAFLGAGHTEKVGKFKENVRKAIQWIISQQRADGAIGADKKFSEHHGGFAYHHSICGMALAEAGAMGRVRETIAAAQKAVDYSCEKHQHGSGSDKGAWRYKPKAKVADISASGWFVMQLKSAKVAGLQVDPASFEGAIKLLDQRMADPANVKKVADGYDNGKHRYGYLSRKPAVNPTAIGILCRLFTGSKPEEVRGGAAWLLKEHPPEWKATLGPNTGESGYWPLYYTYYNTLTMFQIGGDLWKQWNDKMKRMLVENQRKGGAEDGSWDPMSKEKLRGGRVMSTALGVMCLEVYYRYMPLYRN